VTEFGGDARQEVAASPLRCFEVAAAVESYPDWHAAIAAVRVIERDDSGRPAMVEAEVDAGVTTVKLRLRFAYDPGSVRCARESGDLSTMRASFAFAELGQGRTEVSYSTMMDPGRMLSMVVRGPVAERLRMRLVDDVVAGFKRAVEAR
jgi:ribosome-associated toxin RatA of RatAB toxin-antitoxin module